MKVVFMEEVEGTANVGEIKNVADGFARNYLLPRRLAAPATEHYITIAQARAEKEARRQARLDDEARTHLVPKMEGSSVTIEVRVGEQGKLFGSVTARDIAAALQETTGVELEHRQVDLRQPIREVGAHEVAVKLTRNVPVTVTVNVEPLGGLPEGTEEAAEGAEEAAPVLAEPEAAEAEAEAPDQPEAATGAEPEVEETPEEESRAEEEAPEEEAAPEAEQEPEIEAEETAETEEEATPEAEAVAAEEEKPAEAPEGEDTAEEEQEPEIEAEASEEEAEVEQEGPAEAPEEEETAEEEEAAEVKVEETAEEDEQQ